MRWLTAIRKLIESQAFRACLISPFLDTCASVVLAIFEFAKTGKGVGGGVVLTSRRRSLEGSTPYVSGAVYPDQLWLENE